MVYVLYSTSNSDYQSWQCKLLEWSFKRVNQPGKLIRLCSFNTHCPDREFDTSEIAEVIKLPDYRTRWCEHTKFVDKDYGIINKVESLKYWLKNYKGLKNTDTVILVDPDMVFQKSIHITTNEGVLIAQRWIDKGIHESTNFVKYGKKIINRLNESTVFMYPYIVTVGDLKKIIEEFVTLTCQMRLDNYPHLWESDMFALIISSLKSLTIKTIPNLGLCTNWSYNKLLDDKKFVDDSYILHYPSSIMDINNNKIFNKQDYTSSTLKKHWKRIYSNDAKTYIERKFLSVLEDYNISKLNQYYWKDINLVDSLLEYSFEDAKKYLVFKPWAGGFNNIRMSLELAASMAYLTNRILVIPDAYKMYLLNNSNSLEEFFDIKDIGIKTIPAVQFKSMFKLNDIFDIKDIAYTISLKDDNALGDAIYKIRYSSDIDKNIIRNRKIVDFSEFENENIIYFDSNLLGNFYSSIFTDYLPELTKYVCRHIHYKEKIFNEAYKVIEILEKQNYYAIHIRRGDFQYKDLVLSIEEIYNNIKQIVPEKAKLYIATDEKDKNFFSLLKEHYEIYFYEDLKKYVSADLNEDLIGPIEQIICTYSKTFIGNKLSTFSSYIYRLRGYINEITDKRFLLYQTKYNSNDTEEENWWIASWAREYDTVWKKIKEVKYFNIENKKYKEKIFVSIASYRDPQLTLTIDSILKNKSNLYDLTIGVCMQDTIENFENFKYKNNPNVKTKFVEFKEAKGVCWARNLIQSTLFSDEDYYLQIDSHSRVCKDWDKILINQINKCPSKKAILSTYPNKFDPEDSTESYFNLKTCPYLKVDKILENKKMIVCSAGVVKDNIPMLGFWVAAGFFFTKGIWAKEVEYTTDFYFTGEEDYLSVRSFEKGWDVYVPEESTVWHDYTDTRMQSPKKYRPLHWEDHPNRDAKEYLIKELYSEKNKFLRKSEDFLDRAKNVSQYKEPNSVEDDKNNQEIVDVRITFNWDNIYKQDESKKVKIIIFAFENKENKEIHRQDIYDHDVISRNKNTIEYKIPKNIHEKIDSCIWFYMYEDGSFDRRMVYKVVKNANEYTI